MLKRQQDRMERCVVCLGKTIIVDQWMTSRTERCRQCQRIQLNVASPRLMGRAIALREAHLRRGEGDNRRPWSDTGMAQGLVDRLKQDVWPTPAMVVDFGIASPMHYRALQLAVGSGVMAYDLDRVIGDGPAITNLIECVRGCDHGVTFETMYDCGEPGQ